MLLAAAAAAPCRAAGPAVDRDQRLILGFIEDGAIVGRGWFEASFSGSEAGDGTDGGLRLVAAIRYGRDVEAGVAAGVLHRQRDAGAPLYGGTAGDEFSQTGIADAVVYGKYRVLRGTFDLALGASVTLPVAGDSTGLSSGALETRGFIGVRGAMPGGWAMVGHLGFADAGTSGYSGAPGRTAIRAGAGALVPLSRIWTLIVEVEHEGAIFEGEERATAVLAGLHWQPTDYMVVRGGLAGGGGRAPEIAGILAVAFQF